MALETLRGVDEIGGFKVLAERPKLADGSVDWAMFDEMRKASPIYVDHDVNMVSFRIQNGPVKENGVNGCQVDTLIAAAKVMLEGLNAKFPCTENMLAIIYLSAALDSLKMRTRNREARGVEGTSQP